MHVWTVKKQSGKHATNTMSVSQCSFEIQRKVLWVISARFSASNLFKKTIFGMCKDYCGFFWHQDPRPKYLITLFHHKYFVFTVYTVCASAPAAHVWICVCDSVISSRGKKTRLSSAKDDAFKKKSPTSRGDEPAANFCTVSTDRVCWVP